VNVVVVAPHPDDETLGCGGTLLRHVAAGERVHWLIATEMTRETGFSGDAIAKRDREIADLAARYGFAAVHRLGFATTTLDVTPRGDLVRSIGDVFRKTEPTVVYLPHHGDSHTDHAVMHEATIACTKWFRYPSIREVLAYETLSETASGAGRRMDPFIPTVYVDIAATLDRKLELLTIYQSEIGAFPFPRSVEAVRALAMVRGSEAGVPAAEAYALVHAVR
jgi:LmbE family N-acetylglucosaminyl deacetylase